MPAVIWIHGGGWTSGDKAGARERTVCETFAKNGYAAFSINYKLGPKPPAKPAGETPDPAAAPWPQNLHDCKSALRYIRQEAARFGIDPSRIAVSGASSGAHLALITGVTGDRAELNQGGLHTGQSSAVSCILNFYGVPEIAEPRTRNFLGATPEETRANLRAASTSTYLGPSTPPILVIHGTADPLVKIDVSRDLVRRLEAAGIAHTFVEVPGARHAFDLQPEGMDLRPAVLEFLAKYLRKPESTPP